VYLVVTRRLFGLRGGKHAYEARLRSESLMEAAINAAAAQGKLAGTAQPAPTSTAPDTAALPPAPAAGQDRTVPRPSPPSATPPAAATTPQPAPTQATHSPGSP